MMPTCGNHGPALKNLQEAVTSHLTDKSTGEIKVRCNQALLTAMTKVFTIGIGYVTLLIKMGK